MNLRVSSQCLLSFIAGVISTALVAILLLFSWDFLSWQGRTRMAAIPSIIKTEDGLTVELGSNARDGVVLGRSSEQVRICPPPRVLWTKMAVAQSGTVAYLVAQEEIGTYYYKPRSLVSISLPKTGEPVSHYDVHELLTESALSRLLPNAVFMDFNSTSTNGERVLVRLGVRGVISTRNGAQMLLTQVPYYYYPRSNSLEVIAP